MGNPFYCKYLHTKVSQTTKYNFNFITWYVEKLVVYVVVSKNQGSLFLEFNSKMKLGDQLI